MPPLDLCYPTPFHISSRFSFSRTVTFFTTITHENDDRGIEPREPEHGPPQYYLITYARFLYGTKRVLTVSPRVYDHSGQHDGIYRLLSFLTNDPHRCLPERNPLRNAYTQAIYACNEFISDDLGAAGYLPLPFYGQRITI